MKNVIIIALLTLTTLMAANAADTLFVNLAVMPDTTVRMTTSGSSAYGPAARKLVISGLAATDTLRMVRWDHPGDQENESVEVFGLTAEGWEWLSTEGDLPNGDTLVASFAGYTQYLVRHIGGPGPGSQWVQVSRIQPTTFPVEWVGFSATSTTTGTVLSWATARETNSFYFAIERRSAGSTWKELDVVQAAGFSESTTTYAWTDSAAPSGRVAYRLRQVDLDGNQSYSDVAEVTIQAEETFKISSLADGSGAWISGLDGRGTLKIFNLSGQLTLSQSISGSGKVNLGLPAGTYVVTVSDGYGSQATGKVIIGR